jgi:hypothetical protein
VHERTRLEANGASRSTTSAKFTLGVLILHGNQKERAPPVACAGCASAGCARAGCSRPQKEDDKADEGDDCQQSGGIEWPVGRSRMSLALMAMG